MKDHQIQSLLSQNYIKRTSKNLEPFKEEPEDTKSRSEKHSHLS